jgi:hypothetical protein
MKKIATFVKHLKEGFQGDARLYRVEPPIEQEHWDFVKEKRVISKYDYVVVSAAVVMGDGPETYIFGADEQGTVLCWNELEGSFRGELNHEKALAGAGFTITAPQ